MCGVQWLANLVFCGIAAVLLRAHRLRCRLASTLARQQSKVINNIDAVDAIDAEPRQRYLFVLYNASSGGQQVTWRRRFALPGSFFLLVVRGLCQEGRCRGCPFPRMLEYCASNVLKTAVACLLGGGAVRVVNG